MSQPDSASFAEWVRPHLPAMAALAARLAGAADRDDVVQEALIRAWRRRPTYDADRGSARVWLLAIVADRAGRHRRRRQDTLRFVDEHVPGGVLPAIDPTGVDIERALDRLPTRMRMAVDCVYFVGLTVGETATLMQVAEGTVKSTLSDARTRLRALLEVRA